MARRLAAIMAGDVVGYSRLMADDEAGTYDSLRAGVDEVVVPSVEGHGGRVFKTTGDGFLAVFGSAGEALDAAMAIQDGFAGRPLQLRIGLNLGDVIEEHGDVFGDGVNVAVAARGHGRARRRSAPAVPWCARSASGPTCISSRSVTGAARTCPTRSRSTRCAAGRPCGAWLPRGRAVAAAAVVALMRRRCRGWQWGEPLADALARRLPAMLARGRGQCATRGRRWRCCRSTI